MNKHLKDFLTRGMAFAGFGPIVAGIVYLIISNSIENFTLSGLEVFVAIISTYVLAFLQAGSNVFHEIESWSIPKSTFCHLATIGPKPAKAIPLVKKSFKCLFIL